MRPGSSDGIRCDTDGNVWAAAGGGGDGLRRRPRLRARRQAHRPHPAARECANLCFGGVKRNRLFMAASQSVYALYVEAQGATLS